MRDIEEIEEELAEAKVEQATCEFAVGHAESELSDINKEVKELELELENAKLKK